MSGSQITSQNRPGQSKYESLDGVRAYAAIGIVVMHVLCNISVKPTDCYLTKTIIPFFTDFTLLIYDGQCVFDVLWLLWEDKEWSDNSERILQKAIHPYFALFILLNLIGLAVEPSIGALQEVYANLTLAFNLLPDSQIEMIGVG